MLYTIDTEFWEQGARTPIGLISVGIVREDGLTYYATNRDFDWLKVPSHHWLIENVFPKLGANPNTEKSRRQIKADLVQFFARDAAPQIWAYFADYDWVVLCGLFGTMLDLPPNMPQMCLDIEQLRLHLGLLKTVYTKQDERTEHNALADAQWDMEQLKMLLAHQRAQNDLMSRGVLGGSVLPAPVA